MPHTRTTRDQVSPAVQAFLREPHIGTVTTLRPNGSPHVVPVRFTFDAEAGIARIMTVGTSRKAKNLIATDGGRVAVCQVDGFRWVTLEGRGAVVADPVRVTEGARRYAERYRSAPPAPPGRVVVEIEVDRVVSLNV